MNAEQQEEFKQAAIPLIKWLNANVHPHHYAIVSPTKAELVEGVYSTGEMPEFVQD